MKNESPIFSGNQQRYIPQTIKKPQTHFANTNSLNTSFAPKDFFKNKVVSPKTKAQQDMNIQKSLQQNFKSTSFGNLDQINYGGSGQKSYDTSLLFKKGNHPNYNPNFKKGSYSNQWGANRTYSAGSQASRKSGSGQKLIYLEIVGPNTIALKFENFYDPDIKDKIKAMPDARYEHQTKEWLLRKDLKERLLEQIGNDCIERGVQVFDTPNFVYDILKNTVPFSNSKSFKSFGLNYEQEVKNLPKLEKLPTSLAGNLYEFQKKGIEFGISRFGRILLGDEMGVGKTIQAIGIAYLYKFDWPLFVVTPSSLRYTWKDEILKWLPQIKSEQIQIFKTGKDQWNSQAIIYIMTYDLAMKRYEEIDERNFKVCVADEAHYLKSRDSKRSKHLIPILSKSKRVILISGTPMLAKPEEVYNLLKILRPDIIGKFTEFAARYCNPQQTPYKIDYGGNSCTKELHYVLSQSIMIRRLKKDVLSELPPKRRQKIQVQTDPKLLAQIKKILNNLMDGQSEMTDNLIQTLITKHIKPVNFDDYIDEQKKEQAQAQDIGFMTAYRLTGLSKIDGITEFMDTLIENNCKFIIFAHHLEVLDGLEEHVKKEKVGYIRIDGSVSVDRRHERVQAFQNNDNIRIAVLSITACSQGLTLTAASTIVFAEMFWTPSIMTQAEDRAHRISQQNCVNIYYMHGPDTVDDIIFQMLSEKSQIVSDALDGKISEYHIKKAQLEECLEEVKELKEKGTLNPIITKKKKEPSKNKIEDFFKKSKDTENNFVKKVSKSKNPPLIEEDIDEDSESEEVYQSQTQITQSKKRQIKSSKQIELPEIDANQDQEDEEFKQEIEKQRKALKNQTQEFGLRTGFRSRNTSEDNEILNESIKLLNKIKPSQEIELKSIQDMNQIIEKQEILSLDEDLKDIADEIKEIEQSIKETQDEKIQVKDVKKHMLKAKQTKPRNKKRKIEELLEVEAEEEEDDDYQPQKKKKQTNKKRKLNKSKNNEVQD
ncbi:snf2 family n-terminal domain containing protein [Stylonychia lemnae]|uniref:Snf2 family n-terminal domain containing protein n=1 Tax=Stylonychia lemnae TaxID=5949 RepID=A0A078AEH7_STYLE|nr:snf2 family n-terminal domain containing protein [Stylonychia lemnae]|eukprot:CDW80246.1 snf2 family n-terminal domain containing protein [Stylonychia lemnae]